MAVRAQDRKISSWIQRYRLTLHGGERRQMVSFYESPAEFSIRRLEVEATRHAFVAVYLLGILRELLVSLYPFVLAEPSKVLLLDPNLVILGVGLFEEPSLPRDKPEVQVEKPEQVS